jgi:hypothetical protein
MATHPTHLPDLPHFQLTLNLENQMLMKDVQTEAPEMETTPQKRKNHIQLDHVQIVLILRNQMLMMQDSQANLSKW